MSPCNTDDHEIIRVGMVFRSIGYHGVPCRACPSTAPAASSPPPGTRRGQRRDAHPRRICGGLDQARPHRDHRHQQARRTGNRCQILEDIEQGGLPQTDASGLESIPNCSRNADPFVTYADWQLLDQIEQERGALVGRPRLKFSRVEDMLGALAEAKREPAPLLNRSNGKTLVPEPSGQVAQEPDLQPGARRNVDRTLWHNKQTVRQDH